MLPVRHEEKRSTAIRERVEFRWLMTAAMSSIIFSGIGLAGAPQAVTSAGYHIAVTPYAKLPVGPARMAGVSLAAIRLPAHGEAWNAPVRLMSSHSTAARGEAWNAPVAGLTGWHETAAHGEAWNAPVRLTCRHNTAARGEAWNAPVQGPTAWHNDGRSGNARTGEAWN